MKAGDVEVACVRNTMLIGRGKSVEDAKTEVGQVVEGRRADYGIYDN